MQDQNPLNTNPEPEHSHTLPENPDGHTVVAVKEESKLLRGRRKFALSGVALVLIAVVGFGGFALNQNLKSNAGGEDTLGDMSMVEAPGLTAPIPGETFSLDGTPLQAQWLPSYSEEEIPRTSTYPYPKSGADYRISRSASPTSATSWKPAGANQKLYFHTSKAGLGYWSPSEIPYPEEGSGTGKGVSGLDGDYYVLPQSEIKPGQTYYFRAEVLNDQNQWVTFNDEVLEFKVPTATLSLGADPEYGDDSAWYSFGNGSGATKNPKININWIGNSTWKEGSSFRVTELNGRTAMFASDGPEMSNKTEVLSFDDGGQVTLPGPHAFPQQPNSTKYYSIYSYDYDTKTQVRTFKDKVSDTLRVITPKLSVPPKLVNSHTGPRDIVVGLLDEATVTNWVYNPSATYTIERSTKPDGIYDPKDSNSFQKPQQTSPNFADYDIKADLTYYYRVKQNTAKWQFSDTEWTQVLAVKSGVLTYDAPLVNVKNIGFDKLTVSYVAKSGGQTFSIEQSTDGKSYGSFKSTYTGVLSDSIDRSSLKPNTTYYYRVAYKKTSSTSEPDSYTQPIKVKTLRSPYDSSALSCTLSAPASITQGKNTSVTVKVKNSGDNTYLGKVGSSGKTSNVKFTLNGTTDKNKAYSLSKSYGIGAIAPGATKTITYTFKASNGLKKGTKATETAAFSQLSAASCKTLTKKNIVIK